MSNKPLKGEEGQSSVVEHKVLAPSHVSYSSNSCVAGR